MSKQLKDSGVRKCSHWPPAFKMAKAVNIQDRETLLLKAHALTPRPGEKRGLSWILGMLVEWVTRIKEHLDLLFWWHLWFWDFKYKDAHCFLLFVSRAMLWGWTWIGFPTLISYKEWYIMTIRKKKPLSRIIWLVLTWGKLLHCQKSIPEIASIFPS